MWVLRARDLCPAPACYGAGGEEATNTDTQIVLGRINPDYFLGGEMTVYPELSHKALKEKIGDVYGWSAQEAAANMYMVAMTNLMLALRLQTVSRGWDPRDFAMIPYGGGGAMYACDIARECGVTTVVVPPLPGYASALGACRVDVRHEFVQPIFTLESQIDYDKLNKEMDKLVKKAIEHPDERRDQEQEEHDHSKTGRCEVLDPEHLFYRGCSSGQDQEFKGRSRRTLSLPCRRNSVIRFPLGLC